MPVRPYLLFDGNARDALAFYEYVFDTQTESIITFGEIPPNPDFPIPDEVKARVWFGRITIGGDTITISDIGPFPGYTVGNNIDILYINPSKEEIGTVYNRIMEEGSAQVELVESPGDKLYANVKDKFGISWQLSTHESLV